MICLNTERRFQVPPLIVFLLFFLPSGGAIGFEWMVPPSSLLSLLLTSPPISSEFDSMGGSLAWNCIGQPCVFTRA
ncbi:hypothetical protein F5H01DRAFT_333125 [Linnemannia elongata]|nr:hypothetical protein F5H01DRAFT_333125 [Linnemannia elongata]